MQYSVNILGDGLHATRYKDALLFSSYSIIANNIEISDLDTHASDILIIPEPDMFSSIPETLFQALANYEHVLCEKLPFYEMSKIEKYSAILKDVNIHYIHSRLYDNLIKVPRKQEIIINWPNLYSANMNPMWNTLPNAIDFLFKQTGSFPNVDDTICYKRDEYYIFKTVLNNTNYVIIIFPGNINDSVIVDGQPIPWPNYMTTYQRAFEQAMQRINHGVDYTYSEIKLINQLLERNSIMDNCRN